MNLTLGISPCPNDTFIFAAMALGLVDTAPFEIDFHFADVEELNQRAAKTQLDATKLSFNAFADLTSSYQLLPVGSALGRSCGPLLITLDKANGHRLKECVVAVPGVKTTANFLLDFYGEVGRKHHLRFDQIESAILAGDVDAGVIIHENRFTYSERGLHKIVDLGDHWELTTRHPIPLGGIAIGRGFAQQSKLQLTNIISKSLHYAYQNTDQIMPFVREHAQEMDEQVMQKHIALYVNEYTADLGADGSDAIECFLNELLQHRHIELKQPWLVENH